MNNNITTITITSSIIINIGTINLYNTSSIRYLENIGTTNIPFERPFYMRYQEIYYFNTKII